MREASIALLRTCRPVMRAMMAAAGLAVACALGGCAGGGGAVNSFAMAGSGPTIAFESIDGPPQPVFDRMVGVLNSESKLRSLSIVSREGVGRLPGTKLSRRPGKPRTNHHRLGLGRLRPEPAARAASVRRGTGRQGRARPLDRRRRSGLAQDCAGRVQRAEQHDQSNGAGRCPSTCSSRSSQTRPCGGKRRSARPGFRRIQRQRAGLHRPLAKTARKWGFLPRKTGPAGCHPRHPLDITSPVSGIAIC